MSGGARSELCKITKKSRDYDDLSEGVTYILKGVYKTGKKGELSYRKVTITIEEGIPDYYREAEPQDRLKVSWVNTTTKLTSEGQSRFE